MSCLLKRPFPSIQNQDSSNLNKICKRGYQTKMDKGGDSPVFEVDSWNFQHLLDKKFSETFPNLSSFRKLVLTTLLPQTYLNILPQPLQTKSQLHMSFFDTKLGETSNKYAQIVSILICNLAYPKLCLTKQIGVVMSIQETILFSCNMYFFSRT